MLEEEAVSVFRRGGGFTYQIVWQAVSRLTVIVTDTSLSELWAEASLLVQDTAEWSENKQRVVYSLTTQRQPFMLTYVIYKLYQFNISGANVFSKKVPKSKIL